MTTHIEIKVYFDGSIHVRQAGRDWEFMTVAEMDAVIAAFIEAREVQATMFEDAA